MDSRFKAPFEEHQAHNRGGYQMQRRGTYIQRGGHQVFMRDNSQQNRQAFANDQQVNKQAYRNNFGQAQRSNFGHAHRNNFGQSQRGNVGQFGVNAYKRIPNHQNDDDAQNEPAKKREKFGEAKDGQNEKVEQEHQDAGKKVTTGWDESAGHVKYSGQAQKQNDVDVKIQMSNISKELESISIEALPQKEEANEKAKSGEGFHFEDRFDHENCNIKQEEHLKREFKPAVNDYESNFLFLDSRPIILHRRIFVPIVNKGLNYAGFLIGEEGATASCIRRMFNCGYSVVCQYTDEPLHVKITITAPAIEAYERMHRVLKYLHALFEKAHSGQVPQHHQKIKSKPVAEEDKSPICTHSKSIIDKTFAESLQVEVDNSDAITKTQCRTKPVDSPSTAEVVPKLGIRRNIEFAEDSSIDSSMSSFITVHEHSSKIPQHQEILSPVSKTQKPTEIVRDEKSNQLIKEAHNQITKHAEIKKDSKEMSLKKKLALELGRIGHSGNGDSGFEGTGTILTSTVRRDIPRHCAA